MRLGVACVITMATLQRMTRAVGDAGIYPREQGDGPHEREPTGQALLNVVFEAGMAMARHRTRAVLVELGQVRQMSDVAGLDVISMDDSVERREDLAERLRSARPAGRHQRRRMGDRWHIRLRPPDEPFRRQRS